MIITENSRTPEQANLPLETTAVSCKTAAQQAVLLLIKYTCKRITTMRIIEENAPSHLQNLHIMPVHKCRAALSWHCLWAELKQGGDHVSQHLLYIKSFLRGRIDVFPDVKCLKIVQLCECATSYTTAFTRKVQLVATKQLHLCTWECKCLFQGHLSRGY